MIHSTSGDGALNLINLKYNNKIRKKKNCKKIKQFKQFNLRFKKINISNFYQLKGESLTN